MLRGGLVRLGGPGRVVMPVGAVLELERQVTCGRGAKGWCFRLGLAWVMWCLLLKNKWLGARGNVGALKRQ